MLKLAKFAALAVGAVFGLMAADVRPAHAQCKGQDLLAAMKTAQPDDYKRLLESARTIENSEGIFWKISNADLPDVPPSYLFGTVHLSDDRVAALPEAVLTALRSSRRVALEIEDFSPRRLSAAFNALQGETRLPQGRKLDDIIGEPNVQRLADTLGRRGIQRANVPGLRPWFALLMSSLPLCEVSRMASGKDSLDVRLFRHAERAAIGVIGLETLEDQFRALSRLSDDDQNALLKAHMRTFDKIDDATETMVQLWLTEDTGLMQALGRESFRLSGADPEIYQRFETNLLNQRNRAMRGRAITHLTRGGVFIGVGALHLPGAEGLVALIRDLGYKVDRVPLK